MAGLAERIKIYIDVVGDNATNGMKTFRTSVADADGVTGKLKAGWASASDSIKANAGSLALGAGAALVGFGIKAVNAFVDTAKAAIDMGAATGMATEDASRWIAIGDDMGVSAEGLQAAFGKVVKTLDGEAWKKYGIATRDAGGQVRDTNDIVLDAFDVLSKTTSETERARIGNELFGKGYSQIAPMIGKSRTEMEKWLGTVEDGQVVTASEAKRAEEWRLAIDSLQDGLQEVVIAFGSFVAGQAPVIKGFAQLVEWAGKAANALAGAGQTGMDAALQIEDMADQFEAAGLDWVAFKADVMAGAMTLEEALGKLTDAQNADTSARDLATRQAAGYVAMAEQVAETTDDVSEAYKTAALRAAGYAAEADHAERETKALDEAYRKLTGKLSAQESWLSLEDSMRTFIWNMNSGALSADEQALAIVNMKQDLLDHLSVLEDVPATKQTEILSLIDAGKLAEAMAELDKLTAPRFVTVNVKVPPGQSVIPKSGAYASGTEDADPGVALVGEHGPEFVFMRGGEKVVPAGRTRQMMGAGTTVNQTIIQNFPAGATPRDVTNGQRRYRRTQGPT